MRRHVREASLALLALQGRCWAPARQRAEPTRVDALACGHTIRYGLYPCRSISVLTQPSATSCRSPCRAQREMQMAGIDLEAAKEQHTREVKAQVRLVDLPTAPPCVLGPHLKTAPLPLPPHPHCRRRRHTAGSAGWQPRLTHATCQPVCSHAQPPPPRNLTANRNTGAAGGGGGRARAQPGGPAALPG